MIFQLRIVGKSMGLKCSYKRICKTLIIASVTLFFSEYGYYRVSIVNAPELVVERNRGILEVIQAQETPKIPEITEIPQVSDPTTREEVILLIEETALEYGINKSLSIKLASWESQYNPKAKNKITGAGGLYQFLESSWESLKCEGEVFNANDNIKCYAKLIKENKRNISHWFADETTAHLLWKNKFIDCTNFEERICWSIF